MTIEDIVKEYGKLRSDLFQQLDAADRRYRETVFNIKSEHAVEVEKLIDLAESIGYYVTTKGEFERIQDD